jgi:hypothetical protein
MMGEYKETGKLPNLNPNFTEEGISVSGNIKSANPKGSLNEFLQNITRGKSYVAIHAHLKPEKETTNQLQSIRTAIQKKYKVATTVGYGPRFLHSTGQLHKGNAGNGLFIQIIANPKEDLPIPNVPQGDESSISFGVLIKAQAMGDRETLLYNNRNVLILDLGTDLQQNLRHIQELLFYFILIKLIYTSIKRLNSAPILPLLQESEIINSAECFA